MTDTLDDVITRHRRDGILVDTNVLLLFLVGKYDVRRINTFKHTRRYVSEDFDTVELIIGEFDRLVLTPNILTEVSNLAGQMGEPVRTELLRFLGQEIGATVDERYIDSRSAVLESEFPRLGLTDVGIALLAKNRVAVLTDDLDLYLYLERRGISTINFNHVRVLGW